MNLKLNIFFFLFSIIINSSNINIGKKLFLENCSVCHLNGNNIIIPEKNLKVESLKANGINNLESIKYEIINGKNGMPAFGGRLSEEEINYIAKYILKELKN